MQTEVFWFALIGGALCSGFGLLRSLRHFRQWQRTQSEHDGEVVLAEPHLQSGLQATFAPDEASRYTAAEPIPVRILSLQKRMLTLQADGPLPCASQAAAPHWPVVGATIVVILTGKDAAYRFTAHVRDLDSEAGSVVVSRPLWIARIQRRRHFRVPVQFPVILEPAASATLPTTPQGRPLTGMITNLSGGGFRLQLAAVLSPGELSDLLTRLTVGMLLWVRLPVPALEQSPLLVRVRTAERIAVRGGLSGCMTCEFVSLQSWEEDLIVQHLFRVQREQAYARRPLARTKGTTSPVSTGL